MERYRSYWRRWHCRGERKPIMEAEPRGAPWRGLRRPHAGAGGGHRGARRLRSHCPGGICSGRASPRAPGAGATTPPARASHQGPWGAWGFRAPCPAGSAGSPRPTAASPSRTAFPGRAHRSCGYASVSISQARDYNLKRSNLRYFEPAIIPALTINVLSPINKTN